MAKRKRVLDLYVPDGVYVGMPFSSKIKIIDIYYRDEAKQTDWVCFIAYDENGQYHKFNGRIPGLDNYEKITVSGRYKSQFNSYLGKMEWIVNVEQFSPKIEIEDEDIVNYIANLRIPDLGIKTAEKIYNHFQKKTIDTLFHYPDTLHEAKGIGAEIEANICEYFRQKELRRGFFAHMLSVGFSYKTGLEIYNAFGDDVNTVWEEDPYQIAIKCENVGFQKVDNALKREGRFTNSFDEKRIKGVILYELRKKANGGNTVELVSELKPAVFETMGISTAEDKDAIEEAFLGALSSLNGADSLSHKLISIDHLCFGKETAVSFNEYYNAETQTSSKLKSLVRKGCINPFKSKEDLFSDPLSELLTEEQKQAVWFAFDYPVSIITGGPGTGKSYVTRYIYNACVKAGLECIALAPTGKAAKRLAQAIAGPDMTVDPDVSKTIHKALIEKKNRESSYLTNYATRKFYDVIIVDECSMVDIELAGALLKSVKKDARVIFIGDPDQLPSINPGNFFLDLIESEALPVTRLTQIFRQDEGNIIIENAKRINNGLMPICSDMYGLPEDNYFMFSITGENASDFLIKSVVEILPMQFCLDPMNDIQVYSPMHSGICGTDNLNKKLRDALNPLHDEEIDFVYGGKSFRVGDKVIQERNNYEISVMNGDIGRVIAIDKEEETVTVQFDDYITPVNYRKSALRDLSLAYAMTVHKAQGSEIKCAVVVMDFDSGKTPQMVTRKLFYTAVTRARNIVVLIGNRSSFRDAVDAVKINKRETRLKNLLEREFRKSI